MPEHDPRKITAENLAASDALLLREEARRRLWLSDLAYLDAGSIRKGLDAGESPAELFASVGSRFPGKNIERSFYAAALAEQLKLPPERILASCDGGRRTVYVRTANADLAYRAFSEEISGMTAAYRSDSRSVAEDVSSGDADLAILPYADRDGTPVRGTELLAEHGELFLSGVCSVGGEENRLTFALYSRAYLPRPCPNGAELFLRLPVGSEGDLSVPLLLAEALGGMPHLPKTVRRDGEERAAGIAIRLREEHLSVILQALLLFAPGAVFTGLCPL